MRGGKACYFSAAPGLGVSRSQTCGEEPEAWLKMGRKQKTKLKDKKWAVVDTCSPLLRTVKN